MRAQRTLAAFREVHSATLLRLAASLEILSIQRVREFSILITDSLGSKGSALPSLGRFSDSPSRPPSLQGCQARQGGETESNREGRKEDSRNGGARFTKPLYREDLKAAPRSPQNSRNSPPRLHL